MKHAVFFTVLGFCCWCFGIGLGYNIVWIYQFIAQHVH